MKFLKNLFTKEEAIKIQNKAIPKQEVILEQLEKTQRTIDRFYQRLKSVSQKPITYFTLEKTKPGLFDCKIGGAYYVAENAVMPIDQVTKNPLHLLAQINFAQFHVPEGFPATGLLQFFISGDDDIYGCDFDDPKSQKRWTIRYYEDIPNNPMKNCIYQPQGHKETMLPFPIEKEYKLIPHEEMQAITVNDYRFEECFANAYKDLLNENQHTIFDLDNDVYDGLSDSLETYASQIGGYPCFTQYDPREYMKEDIPEILLFQLDTVEDIMWGDSGVANFFITEEDLKNKNFSRVIYNWDCM